VAQTFPSENMMQERSYSGLKRMSEFSHYEVSDDDPDPRGWTVVTRDGHRVGEVTDLLVDDAAMKVRYFEVESDRGGSDDTRLLVDAYRAELVDRERQVVIDGDLVSSQSAGPSSATESVADMSVAHDRGLEREAARVTRAEEELRIGKREVEAGEVVVNKTIDTEHVREPIQRRVERVRVERRPVQAGSTTEADMTPGEIRVPIVEEELVVEKRPVVKEEIVLTRDVDTETEVVEADVRKERVEVHEDVRNSRGRHGRH
jgi:uncharacterized protein (TIGR02271 family)